MQSSTLMQVLLFFSTKGHFLGLLAFLVVLGDWVLKPIVKASARTRCRCTCEAHRNTRNVAPSPCPPSA